MQTEATRSVDWRTGLASAVLREISQHLHKLAAGGGAELIDLRSLPMTDADRAELEERLGHGEVEADLYVSGESLVWETAYAGVWWIRHFGAGGRIASEQIAVVEVPDILVSHRADIARAASRLHDDLEKTETPRAEGMHDG
ncbi:MAG: hydrogenase expression/formation C-terminal domain-containing protein [Devosia sp.]|nr:hydrogenase expression/formation C-terminal domain-containing protein [Devosia sp.]